MRQRHSHEQVSLAGSLLLAHPALRDPNFRRSVILMSTHSADGAMGVVLNRPLGKRLGELNGEFALSPLAGVPLFGGGPVEPGQLLLAGDAIERGWKEGKAKGFDAFDAKAEAVALLEAAGAPVSNLQLSMNAGQTWHPGRSATLGLGKNVLAAFGELHPRVAKALDVPAGTVAAEIYLDAIPAPRASERARPAFAPPALQPVKRDFAFLVPEGLAADALVRAIRGVDKQLITNARLFDRYEGEQGLSLAVEVTLQPGEKSFTDAEIGEISRKVVAAAEKLGATLRG